MKKIIGLCGFIGSGKGTVANILVNEHSFVEDSFAATLKDAVAAVFKWPRAMLEGNTDESRAWREQVDPWWSERLGKPITPRWVLQQWGTEVCRKSFHDDIWILSLERKLATSDTNVVIADCRFPNEIAMIKRLGGEVWRVKRGAEPDWYDHAITYNKGESNIGWAMSKHHLHTVANVHASEYSWVGSNFDKVITNESSIEDLRSAIDIR
jgi:hypothetical protein